MSNPKYKIGDKFKDDISDMIEIIAVSPTMGIGDYPSTNIEDEDLEYWYFLKEYRGQEGIYHYGTTYEGFLNNHCTKID